MTLYNQFFFLYIVIYDYTWGSPLIAAGLERIVVRRVSNERMGCDERVRRVSNERSGGCDGCVGRVSTEY